MIGDRVYIHDGGAGTPEPALEGLAPFVLACYSHALKTGLVVVAGPEKAGTDASPASAVKESVRALLGGAAYCAVAAADVPGHAGRLAITPRAMRQWLRSRERGESAAKAGPPARRAKAS